MTTAIVTGGNRGLGVHIVRELARRGVSVLLAARDEQKAKSAADHIHAELPDARLETGRLDLSDLESVREFAAAYLARQKPLDLLVNNAGVYLVPQWQGTADGFEMQFGVNHPVRLRL